MNVDKSKAVLMALGIHILGTNNIGGGTSMQRLQEFIGKGKGHGSHGDSC